MENLNVGVTKKVNTEINSLKNDVQSVKENINEITELVTVETILHNASYDTSYASALNNNYVWVMPNPIPQGAYASIDIMANRSAIAGDLTVVFLSKNTNETYTKIQSINLTTVASSNFISVDVPDGISQGGNVYIGFYSESNGMGYSSFGETETISRFSYADIDNAQITVSGEFVLNFSYRLIVYKPKNNNIVYVSPDGFAIIQMC